MNLDDKPELTPEDELARAAKISHLYPQLSADKRSFTHFTADMSENETPDSHPISWIKLIIAGLATAMPFIIFEIGVSALSSTTSTTEAGQLGMLSTLYLFFIVSITWITYKYFSKISAITNVSPAIAYWMIILFSIPTTLFIKSIVVSNSSPNLLPFSTQMIIYYVATCAIFAFATVMIPYLIQRQNNREATNIKAAISFIALPYTVGLIIALSKAL